MHRPVTDKISVYYCIAKCIVFNILQLHTENIALRRQHKSIKIVLIGHSGAGKTEFLNCAIGNSFTPERTNTVSFYAIL